MGKKNKKHASPHLSEFASHTSHDHGTNLVNTTSASKTPQNIGKSASKISVLNKIQNLKGKTPSLVSQTSKKSSKEIKKVSKQNASSNITENNKLANKKRPRSLSSGDDPPEPDVVIENDQSVDEHKNRFHTYPSRHIQSVATPTNTSPTSIYNPHPLTLAPTRKERRRTIRLARLSENLINDDKLVQLPQFPNNLAPVEVLPMKYLRMVDEEPFLDGKQKKKKDNKAFQTNDGSPLIQITVGSPKALEIEPKKKKLAKTTMKIQKNEIPEKKEKKINEISSTPGSSSYHRFDESLKSLKLPASVKVSKKQRKALAAGFKAVEDVTTVKRVIEKLTVPVISSSNQGLAAKGEFNPKLSCILSFSPEPQDLPQSPPAIVVPIPIHQTTSKTKRKIAQKAQHKATIRSVAEVAANISPPPTDSDSVTFTSKTTNFDSLLPQNNEIGTIDGSMFSTPTSNPTLSDAVSPSNSTNDLVSINDATQQNTQSSPFISSSKSVSSPQHPLTIETIRTSSVLITPIKNTNKPLPIPSIPAFLQGIPQSLLIPDLYPNSIRYFVQETTRLQTRGRDPHDSYMTDFISRHSKFAFDQILQSMFLYVTKPVDFLVHHPTGKAFMIRDPSQRQTFLNETMQRYNAHRRSHMMMDDIEGYNSHIIPPNDYSRTTYIKCAMCSLWLPYSNQRGDDDQRNTTQLLSIVRHYTSHLLFSLYYQYIPPQKNVSIEHDIQLITINNKSARITNDNIDVEKYRKQCRVLSQIPVLNGILNMNHISFRTFQPILHPLDLMFSRTSCIVSPHHKILLKYFVQYNNRSKFSTVERDLEITTEHLKQVGEHALPFNVGNNSNVVYHIGGNVPHSTQQSSNSHVLTTYHPSLMVEHFQQNQSREAPNPYSSTIEPPTYPYNHQIFIHTHNIITKSCTLCSTAFFSPEQLHLHYTLYHSIPITNSADSTPKYDISPNYVLFDENQLSSLFSSLLTESPNQEHAEAVAKLIKPPLTPCINEQLATQQSNSPTAISIDDARVASRYNPLTDELTKYFDPEYHISSEPSLLTFSSFTSLLQYNALWCFLQLTNIKLFNHNMMLSLISRYFEAIQAPNSCINVLIPLKHQSLVNNKISFTHLIPLLYAKQIIVHYSQHLYSPRDFDDCFQLIITPQHIKTDLVSRIGKNLSTLHFKYLYHRYNTFYSHFLRNEASITHYIGASGQSNMSAIKNNEMFSRLNYHPLDILCHSIEIPQGEVVVLGQTRKQTIFSTTVKLKCVVCNEYVPNNEQSLLDHHIRHVEFNLNIFAQNNMAQYNQFTHKYTQDRIDDIGSTTALANISKDLKNSVDGIGFEAKDISVNGPHGHYDGSSDVILSKPFFFSVLHDIMYKYSQTNASHSSVGTTNDGCGDEIKMIDHYSGDAAESFPLVPMLRNNNMVNQFLVNHEYYRPPFSQNNIPEKLHTDDFSLDISHQFITPYPTFLSQMDLYHMNSIIEKYHQSVDEQAQNQTITHQTNDLVYYINEYHIIYSSCSDCMMSFNTFHGNSELQTETVQNRLLQLNDVQRVQQLLIEHIYGVHYDEYNTKYSYCLYSLDGTSPQTISSEQSQVLLTILRERNQKWLKSLLTSTILPKNQQYTTFQQEFNALCARNEISEITSPIAKIVHSDLTDIVHAFKFLNRSIGSAYFVKSFHLLKPLRRVYLNNVEQVGTKMLSLLQSTPNFLSPVRASKHQSPPKLNPFARSSNVVKPSAKPPAELIRTLLSPGPRATFAKKTKSTTPLPLTTPISPQNRSIGNNTEVLDEILALSTSSLSDLILSNSSLNDNLTTSDHLAIDEAPAHIELASPPQYELFSEDDESLFDPSFPTLSSEASSISNSRFPTVRNITLMNSDEFSEGLFDDYNDSHSIVGPLNAINMVHLPLDTPKTSLSVTTIQKEAATQQILTYTQPISEILAVVRHDEDIHGGKNAITPITAHTTPHCFEEPQNANISFKTPQMLDGYNDDETDRFDDNHIHHFAANPVYSIQNSLATPQQPQQINMTTPNPTNTASVCRSILPHTVHTNRVFNDFQIQDQLYDQEYFPNGQYSQYSNNQNNFLTSDSSPVHPPKNALNINTDPLICDNNSKLFDFNHTNDHSDEDTTAPTENSIFPSYRNLCSDNRSDNNSSQSKPFTTTNSQHIIPQTRIAQNPPHFNESGIDSESPPPILPQSPSETYSTTSANSSTSTILVAEKTHVTTQVEIMLCKYLVCNERVQQLCIQLPNFGDFLPGLEQRIEMTVQDPNNLSSPTFAIRGEVSLPSLSQFFLHRISKPKRTRKGNKGGYVFVGSLPITEMDFQLFHSYAHAPPPTILANLKTVTNVDDDVFVVNWSKKRQDETKGTPKKTTNSIQISSNTTPDSPHTFEGIDLCDNNSRHFPRRSLPMSSPAQSLLLQKSNILTRRQRQLLNEQEKKLRQQAAAEQLLHEQALQQAEENLKAVEESRKAAEEARKASLAEIRRKNAQAARVRELEHMRVIEERQRVSREQRAIAYANRAEGANLWADSDDSDVVILSDALAPHLLRPTMNLNSTPSVDGNITTAKSHRAETFARIAAQKQTRPLLPGSSYFL